MGLTHATFNPDHVAMVNALDGVIPSAQGSAIVDEIMQNSVIMQLAQYEPMTSGKKVFDIYLGGAGAYWVGEGKRIQTTKPTWTQAEMVAHKLGVIVLASREYLHYKQSDFFEFMKPQIAGAFYRKFDSAGLLGVDNPFTQSVVASTTASGNLQNAELNYDSFVGALDAVNEGGFVPNAVVSKVSNTSLLRGMTSTASGVPVSVYDGNTVDGIQIINVDRNIEEFTKGTLILGDFNQMRYGIPYPMSYKISEDATLTTIVDEENNPINLFERELIAMRVTMDIGFMITSDNAFSMIQPETVVTP